MFSLSAKQAMRLCCNSNKVQRLPFKAAALPVVNLSLRESSFAGLIKLAPASLRTYMSTRAAAMEQDSFDAPPAADGRKLFVGNLSFNTDNNSLYAHFTSAGPVVFANVVSRDGRSRGFGFVEYEHAETAQRACEMLDGSELDGREIRVNISTVAERRPRRDDGFEPRERREFAPREPREPRARPDGVQVFVGNLAWGTSWQDLKDHFKQVGFVVSADVVKGPDGRSRGFGFVTFKDQEGAESAISSLNETDLNGRNILVRESTPRGQRE